MLSAFSILHLLHIFCYLLFAFREVTMPFCFSFTRRFGDLESFGNSSSMLLRKNVSVKVKWHPGADSISGDINITTWLLFKHAPVRTRPVRPCLILFRTVQLTQIKCMQSWSAVCKGCRILLCPVRRDIQWWKFDTEHLLMLLNGDWT